MLNEQSYMHTSTRSGTRTKWRTHTQKVGNTYCFPTTTMIRERASILRHTYIVFFFFFSFCPLFVSVIDICITLFILLVSFLSLYSWFHRLSFSVFYVSSLFVSHHHQFFLFTSKIIFLSLFLAFVLYLCPLSFIYIFIIFIITLLNSVYYFFLISIFFFFLSLFLDTFLLPSLVLAPRIFAFYLRYSYIRYLYLFFFLSHFFSSLESCLYLVFQYPCAFVVPCAVSALRTGRCCATYSLQLQHFGRRCYGLKRVIIPCRFWMF
jgi:hypothetical protein